MCQELETATERGAWLGAELKERAIMRRPGLTVAEIQQATGMTEDGAWKLAYRVSRILPLVYADKRWSMVLSPVEFGI